MIDNLFTYLFISRLDNGSSVIEVTVIQEEFNRGQLDLVVGGGDKYR